MYGNLQEFASTMAQMKRNGQSLRDIGEHFGCSYERVRQILNSSPESTELDPLLITSTELSEMFGVSQDTVRKRLHRAGIRSMNLPRQKTIYDRRQAISEMSKYKICRVCGRPIPTSSMRRSYCSEHCSEVGLRRLHINGRFRELHRRKGLKIPPSVDYVANSGLLAYRRRIVNKP